ncbi:DNA polymerase-like [Zingiber officinale]|uniref:DNA polymerase-like n=1 Tax=Zingiber officinale TaxID=94328 RepID=UPI001C4D1F1B|nr:DNA polymerase-like [Zingiber officinale]
MAQRPFTLTFSSSNTADGFLGDYRLTYPYPVGTLPNLKVISIKLLFSSSNTADGLLLGGIMLKAQSLCWERYGVDIENVLSSLALTIFRKNYYNEEENPIYVLNQNQDTFIWRGDFGGHSDLYLPEGENLWYYDQNSLFPSVMASEPMPAGARRTSLEDQPLESLFGFFEALRGYVFERKRSPFEHFVNDLYASRIEAKSTGNEPLSYLYKLILNSIYGRFGIHPESEVSEICSQARYYEILKKDPGFKDAHLLSPECYLVIYAKNRATDEIWEPPKYSALHLSAARTSYARIKMQPFISTRRDCFYSDTDSLVISEPLPNELVSSTKLGYFKLEHRIKRGIFLASYALQLEDNNYIIKHKGMAKAHVTFDWFERQLLDPKDITIQNPFRIMWSNLTMRQVETRIRLRILSGTKRDLVYDDNGKWIGTKPIKIIDLGNPEQTALMKSTEERMTELREENLRLRNLLLQGDKDKGAIYASFGSGGCFLRTIVVDLLDGPRLWVERDFSVEDSTISIRLRFFGWGGTHASDEEVPSSSISVSSSSSEKA